MDTPPPVANYRRRSGGGPIRQRGVGAGRGGLYPIHTSKNSSTATDRRVLTAPTRGKMKLLIQPEHGAAPLIKEIDGAKKRIEIAIFRFDHTEIERALERA